MLAVLVQMCCAAVLAGIGISISIGMAWHGMIKAGKYNRTMSWNGIETGGVNRWACFGA